MTIAFWCVLIAGILPYVMTGYAKSQAGKRYDNNAPRVFLDHIEGKAQRAHWAQLNAFEAFPLFAAGVVVAHMAGASPHTSDVLAMVFIASRLAYNYCYISDRASLRTLVWTLGFLSVVGQFVAAAMA